MVVVSDGLVAAGEAEATAAGAGSRASSVGSLSCRHPHTAASPTRHHLRRYRRYVMAHPLLLPPTTTPATRFDKPPAPGLPALALGLTPAVHDDRHRARSRFPATAPPRPRPG